MPLDPAFVKATTDVKKLTVEPPNADKLQVRSPDLVQYLILTPGKLYGWYKVAHSEDISVATKPPVYDFAVSRLSQSWNSREHEI